MPPTLLAAALALAAAAAAAQEEKTTVLALPTPQQAAWQDMELGMFVHFAPNTWSDREGDDLSVPLEKIKPDKLNTDQWVSVAQSMGAKYVVFVAKHEGGFCMWQTDTTDYGIKNTPWRGGKGDILKDLAESCRKKAMKLGVYLSPADRKHGAAVGGKCASKEAQQEYNELYRRQLTEVLSRYGEMSEVWFDGSLVVEVGDILRQHAPKAMVFQGPHATIRWVGNEDGVAPYPAWNSVREADAKSGVATAANAAPDGAAWLPNECDARIRSTWFWNTRNAGTLKPLTHLMDMYNRSVGRGAVLLLNNTPDTTGAIPEADARRSAEFGAEIKRRYAAPLAETRGAGEEVELDLGGPQTIDCLITMEDIARGERVREYVLEAMGADGWNQLCKGTAIGHKKIDLVRPVRASKVRLRVTKSAAVPQIRKLAACLVNPSAAPAEPSAPAK